MPMWPPHKENKDGEMPARPPHEIKDGEMSIWPPHERKWKTGRCLRGPRIKEIKTGRCLRGPRMKNIIKENKTGDPMRPRKKMKIRWEAWKEIIPQLEIFKGEKPSLHMAKVNNFHCEMISCNAFYFLVSICNHLIMYLFWQWKWVYE